MSITNFNAQRDFMRRMIRAYEQDLIQLINQTPDHPGGDWAKDDLATLEYLRSKTFFNDNKPFTFLTMNYTLKQLQERVTKLIEQQGEDAHLCGMDFTLPKIATLMRMMMAILTMWH